MATKEIKLINGKKYPYLSYYDEVTKKKKPEYCGSNNKIDSRDKAIKKEIKILVSKKLINTQFKIGMNKYEINSKNNSI